MSLENIPRQTLHFLKVFTGRKQSQAKRKRKQETVKELNSQVNSCIALCVGHLCPIPKTLANLCLQNSAILRTEPGRENKQHCLCCGRQWLSCWYKSKRNKIQMINCEIKETIV